MDIMVGDLVKDMLSVVLMVLVVEDRVIYTQLLLQMVQQFLEMVER